MLVRCATVLFCSQVVQVYFQPCRRNLLLEGMLKSKIAKRLQNFLFWEFKVICGHWCWYHCKARH